MRGYFAAQALLPQGWAEDVRIEVGPEGNIVQVEPGAAPDELERLPGIVLPGMGDVHCHAFQRALAGLAERLGSDEASFWSWRQTMYAFLARLGPDDVAAIAAQLYMELLKGGYTAVGEFHYLHHAPDGTPYDDPATMALALHEAASEVGIGLTLLPALYMTGGFGDQSLDDAQRRFRLDPDQLFRLLERLDRVFRDDPARRLGFAPHSLRAVPPAALREAVLEAARRDVAGPIHIHLAEQVREVRECLEQTGRRPLERLMELAELGAQWCIVHGTHLDEDELERLAASGAVVGLCPTTEANLGDGVFPLAAFLDHGGRFAIGSDSNVATSVSEELRLLEYGQRLTLLRRCVGASRAEPHCGALLWRRALAGAALALGRPVGRIAPGFRADLVALEEREPSLVAKRGDQILDALVFAPAGGPVPDVMVGGVWRIRHGRHAAEARISEAYRATLRRLLA
jgi:formimidoylglutamate deiminase